MRITAIAALIACAAFAQQTRVFEFKQAGDSQQIQEAATLIRSIAQIRDVSVDTAARTATFGGTPEQISIAAWLAAEIDGPAPDRARREFVVAGSAEDVVRVIYVPYATSLQDFQELATLVRSIGQIRSLFTYNASRAIALRGTPDQAALAEWLVDELNSPTAHQPPQYTFGADTIRVHYLSGTATVQDFQEIATLIRAIAEIPSAFTHNRTRALALRANSDQLAIAGWLVTELRKPVPSRQYPGTIAGGEGLWVFQLPAAATPQRLQEVAVDVRTSTGLRRLFTLNTSKVIAVRGTPDQLAAATRIITEHSQPR